MTGFARHDICLVDFNPANGREIGKLRPAIIMSAEEDNTILPTVIVIPLSTEVEPYALPYRYCIEAREQLHKDSDACINEIRALSKNRVKKKLASLTQEEIEIVKKALCDLIV